MKIIKQNAHLQSLLQAIVLFAFALYFIVAVVTGSVYRYVHERHVPILLCSAAVFLLLGILKLRQGRFISVSLSDISLRNRYSGILGIAAFAAALLSMVSASGSEVRFSQFAYTDSIGGHSVIPSVNIPPSASAIDSIVDSSVAVVAPFAPSSDIVIGSIATDSLAAASSRGDASPVITAPSGAESKMQTSEDYIVMDDDNFAQWLTELYTKPDVWAGKKITASGSVWKDGALFEKDEFALARMMMTCCAADMQPVGVLAQWSDVQALTDGEWIEVTGTLSKKTYKDSFDPLIIVETIKKIAPPQREYIYP